MKELNDIFLEKKFKKVAQWISPNSKVLDIGCNEGKIRAYLKESVYYGVDLDKQAVKKLNSEGIKAKAVDLNKSEIPFKSVSFDYILLLDVLEHLTDPRKIISSLKKSSSLNAKIIISLPNDYHLLNKIRFLFNKPLTEDVFSPTGHLHYFPIKTGEEFLKSNNLKILDKEYISAAKPRWLPVFIKELLSTFFPNNFSRDTLYLCTFDK